VYLLGKRWSYTSGKVTDTNYPEAGGGGGKVRFSVGGKGMKIRRDGSNFERGCFFPFRIKEERGSGGAHTRGRGGKKGSNGLLWGGEKKPSYSRELNLIQKEGEGLIHREEDEPTKKKKEE